MEKNDIFNLIGKLKTFEEQISGPDEVDDVFLDNLNKVLNQINNGINDELGAVPVKIKLLHPLAKVPTYSKDGDAGMDLTITSIIDETTDKITYGFGVAMEIPKNYVGLVFPRSSVRKFELLLSNCVGVIDSGYRGEIQGTFNKIDHKSLKYSVGDRGAQIIIIPYPQIKFIEVDELSNTERGEGGYGSTGL